MERHKHAPEMNKLIVRRNRVVKGRLPAPGCVTVTEAKRRNGIYPVWFMRFASVHTEYPAPYVWLNRTVRHGMLCKMEDLKAVLRTVHGQYCARGDRVLHDGSVLPVPKIRTVVCLAVFEH